VRKAVVASLGEAWLSLVYRHGPDPRRWAWGPIHALRFRPLLGAGPKIGPLAHGGGPHALLAGSYALDGAAEGRFDVRVAGTARFAIDADSLDLSLVALAPGQSEHAAHPHFDDALVAWSEGRFALLATRQLEVEDRSVARLVLEPVR
jgi:penicillin amidase